MIFSPAFLDSSSCWNTSHNQLQLQQIASSTHITSTPPTGPGDGGGNNSTHSRPQEGLMATAVGGGGVDGGGCAGDGDGGGSGNSKPMSMPERARLARVPQPEPGLNCPRCDSINTKFCYFNNYSLTQPRYFCRACRRYWTHGGALRNVPVGSGCRRRHAKRSAKPKAASAAGAATIGTSFATSMMPSTITCTTGTATATAPSGLQYSMFDSTLPFTDNFDPANLGLSFPARMLFADAGAYAADGSGHHHNQQQQGNGNGVEQWAAAQMHSFPFLHGMDHQMSGPPAAAMPTTMAANAMQGMFHLGLQSDGSGNGEDDGGDHQFHHHATLPAKRDHEQSQQDYPSSRGMYGNIVNGGDGYSFYSSTSNAVRNY